MTEQGNGHPRNRLSEYLDDALEVEARELVDRHLAACEDCRVELAAMLRLKGAVADETVPPVPPDLAARIGRTLDAATVARPGFRRFAIPATIAATLGAAALLVALQWREGRFQTPAVPLPEEKTRALDELAPANAPSTEVAQEKEAARREALDKDVKRIEEPAVEEPFKEKKAEGAPGNVVGGVKGGVPGGVASGGIGETARSTRQPAVADDERRDTGAAKARNETAAASPEPSAPFAPAPVSAAKAAKANAEGEVSCMESWTDSGLRGSWDVPDLDQAERALGRVAHAVSGIGFWRGVAEGRPYIVVVPEDRLGEVVSALSARGVTGFPDRTPPFEGTGCAGIFIDLRLVPAAPRR